MGHAADMFEDAMDSIGLGGITEAVEYTPLGWGIAADKAVGKAWGAAGMAKKWEKATGGSSPSSLSSGEAAVKSPDETSTPAVEKPALAADPTDAQGLARRRARGIMETYTRYDTSSGKTKLGE